MSNIRTALERALEVLEMMTLQDLQKYPQAERAIPLLRDCLIQEEECAHSFQWQDTVNEKRCVGCNIKEEDQEPREKGPWAVKETGTKIVVESEDFHHDVTLTIQGDFESDPQKLVYARMIARRLNQP